MSGAFNQGFDEAFDVATADVTPTTSNATVSGALKYVIESGGLGVTVFRDLAPPKAPCPLVVITEGVAWNILPHGDTDAEGELVIREQAQVDIYQALKRPDGNRAEQIGLEDRICWLVARSKLPSWLITCYGVQILTRSSQRPSDNLRRTIVTVQIDRLLAAPTV
jgi:hypothetical protein